MNLRLRTVFDAPRRLDIRSRAVQTAIQFWAAGPFMPSAQSLNITISHSHRFIWYRVAKVATRSTLQGLRDQGVVFEAEHPMAVCYPLNTYDSYFKFAFVRNPWSRVVSCWKNKIVDRHLAPPDGVVRWRGLPDAQLQQLESFSGFVSYVESLSIDTCDIHLRSQSKLIDLNHIDFLGRYENMEQDMEEVFVSLGLPARALPKINQSTGGETYRDHYDADLIERVARIYRRDIQIFGYTFDN